MADRNVIFVVAGLVLVAFNMAVVGTVATGAVEGAVQEMFQTYTKDSICEDDDCTELNDDWLISTSERDFYAWNLTNVDEIMADPSVNGSYQEIGPVTYEITTERTLIGHDSEAGTITYSEINSFEWKSGVSPDTPITALNILFEPQRIGATSLALESAYSQLVEAFNGTENATAKALTSFGAEDPVNGGYQLASLNVGGLWGSWLSAYHSSNPGPVNLTMEQSENILFGPLGLTGDACVMFLYGEISGHSIPLDPVTMAPSATGVELTWNDSTVAALYGIDANAAAALRYFVNQVMFKDQVPNMLEGMFGEAATGYPGATKYVTHSVSEWLFGWRDPLMAQLAGDPTNIEFGWQSLETNKTYYGSPNISTGNATTYTVCTGENPTCDTGETLLQDGSTYLFWRSPEMEASTFGGVGAESLVGTSGGFLTGEGDLLNLGDYAIVEPTQQADGEHLGMPVEVWAASVEPGERSIQAKLTNQQSIVDIFPGAVPIYFSADVELKVQCTARVIVSGESTSYFYLDTRRMTEQALSPPEIDDLQPVFKIETSGAADQDTVDQMQSGIIDNQKQLTYWTNFDTGASSFFIDQITVLIYFVSMLLIIVGCVGFARGGNGNGDSEGGNESSDIMESKREPVDAVMGMMD